MILTKNWNSNLYDHSITVHLVRPTYPELNTLMSFNECLSVSALERNFNNLISFNNLVIRQEKDKKMKHLDEQKKCTKKMK